MALCANRLYTLARIDRTLSLYLNESECLGLDVSTAGESFCPDWKIYVKENSLRRTLKLEDVYGDDEDGEPVTDERFMDEWKDAYVTGLSDGSYPYLRLNALVFPTAKKWKLRSDGSTDEVMAVLKSPVAYQNSIFEANFGFKCGGDGYSPEKKLVLLSSGDCQTEYVPNGSRYKFPVNN